MYRKQKQLAEALEWQGNKEKEGFTIRSHYYPEDGIETSAGLEWYNDESKWLLDRDAYPDPMYGEEPSDTELSHLYEFYDIPNENIPIEWVRILPPSKLTSLSNFFKDFGGSEKANALITNIKERGYNIDQYIGSGGFGYVFKASKINSTKTIALKFLKPPYSKDWEKRFKREIGILETFKGNTKVASLLDAPIQINGIFIIPMEFIKGRPLSDLKIPMAPDLCIYIISGILNSLIELHEKSIIHRATA